MLINGVSNFNLLLRSFLTRFTYYKSSFLISPLLPLLLRFGVSMTQSSSIFNDVLGGLFLEGNRLPLRAVSVATLDTGAGTSGSCFICFSWYLCNCKSFSSISGLRFSCFRAVFMAARRQTRQNGNENNEKKKNQKEREGPKAKRLKNKRERRKGGKKTRCNFENSFITQIWNTYSVTTFT